MASLVTVAIPVLDGGPLLRQVLAAVCDQQVDRKVELLVADSGSTDGSREAAEAAGARVLDVPRGEFSHGGTRNRLMAEARGDHVAFLTQDAVPATSGWLAGLLAAFDLADDVGLAFGPYRPRPDSSPMVRRETVRWFTRLAPDGEPRVDRAGDEPADPAARDRKAYFTDANGCVARRAWERVPFRAVAYAEDQMLARDMLSAGWAKAYYPAAPVVHSHDYTLRELFLRSFDEARALLEVHGHRGHTSANLPLVVQRLVRDDLAMLRAEGAPPARRAAVVPRSAAHHIARTGGEALGMRADRIPPRARRLLSLEGRGGFEPQAPAG